ncbi:MAG: uracil-DNA glycosylase, partial [Pseudolabrys sp.]
MTPGNEKIARALLGFYSDAGVDALLEEAPVDRFADDTPPPAAAIRAPRPQAPASASPGAAARTVAAPPPA